MQTTSGKRARHSQKDDPLKSIELFSGAGGMALGVHEAGFSHVAMFESDPRPLATLRANVASGILLGVDKWQIRPVDVRDVPDFGAFGALDLVAGGAPCQPFSNAGRRKGSSDERNMIPEYVRAVREAAPRAFIFENVRGLVNANFHDYFSYVRLQLRYPEVLRRSGESWERHRGRLRSHDAAGSRIGQYSITCAILNSADYGVPQARERLFIVGFRTDLRVGFDFPNATHSRDALLRDQYISRAYWDRHGIRFRAPVSKLKSRIDAIAELEVDDRLPWRTVRDAIGHLREPCLRERDSDPRGHYLYPGARSYHGHTGSDWDTPAKTLKAGAHGVAGGENTIAWPNGRVRYLTEYEAARLQTFPEAWSFVGGWQFALRQIGNAVPPMLAESVSKAVHGTLVSYDASRNTDATRRGQRPEVSSSRVPDVSRPPSPRAL